MDIIANPNSGKGNGKKALESIKAFLVERGIAHRIFETEHAGHGKEIAERLCATDTDGTIVALGGDGTFHEVLNGIDFDKARMGLVPAGRGNDFASGTCSAHLDPIKAIADIVRGEPRNADYIQISDKRCINVAGTGLDVEVLLKTANSRNKLTYVKSLAKCLFKFKPYHIEAEINGETHVQDCIMIGVCNGTQFGAGMKLCPVAKADDGKLDIMIIEKPKHRATITVMPTFIKGKHMNKPYAHHFVCDRIKVTTPAPIELDGEIYYDLDFDARIVPGGLKTFAVSE